MDRLAAVCVVLLVAVGSVWAETPVARVQRLAKLAGNALLHNRKERGEQLLDEALEAAQDAIVGMQPSPYGEFPVMMKAYSHLLDRRVRICSSTGRLDSAVTAAESGLDTIELMLSRISPDDVWAITSLLKAYFATLGKVVWARSLQGRHDLALQSWERGLDVLEQVLATIPSNSVAVMGHVLKTYCDLVGKLVKGYYGQGKMGDAERLLSRAHAKLVDCLGSDHPKVVQFSRQLEAFRAQH